MLPRERIAAAVRAGAHGGEPAVVAFITAGYPRREQFREHLTAVAAGADVVEIGVPFTDPMADGMTIQRSSHEALRQGVNLRWILDELNALPRLRTPLLLMSYLNPLLAYGLDRLPQAARAAGVSGCIVPDLPYEEADDLKTALNEANIALVQMVTPVTEDARLEMLCAGAQGFIYAVTMTGTTGKAVDVPDEALAYMQRVKRAAAIPVCAGFGIRSRAQVERLGAHVDGVIVGSALVEILERAEDPQPFLRSLMGET